jgi:hypothetical protein
MYYASGVKAAFEVYGIRVASLQRRMPDGPAHLGPERLTRLLAEMDDGRERERQPRKDLSRPVQWGQPASLEGSDSSADVGGFGQFGGV